MKKAMLLAVFAVAAVSVFGGGQEVGTAVVNIFTNQAVTASYVASDTLDLNSFDSAAVIVSCGTPVIGITSSIKYQWSVNSTTWGDEAVRVSTSTNATEQLFAPMTSVVTFGLSTNNAPFTDRVKRQARYFRVSVKGSAATNATVSVSAVKMNNNN